MRFEKLSALIKGHLVRRLLKTDKIQGIITSLKDITMIALQLQQESRENPNLLEDVQLHARLLLQHQRETNGFHDIFFKYTSQQRMAIIRCDREIQAQKKYRQPQQR